MTREIKFRVKIKGDAWIYDVWVIDWLNLRALIQRACGDEWVDFKKIKAFLQGTGLSDKNGREIFEGDVVAVDVDFGTEQYPDARTINEVVEFKGAAFYPVCEEQNFEIIGNIYSNPELLEGIG